MIATFCPKKQTGKIIDLRFARVFQKKEIYEQKRF